MTEQLHSNETIREVISQMCPGTCIFSVKPGPVGYSSKLWIAESDDGPLLVRVPLRDPSAERLRAMIAATRLASEAGVPTVRFRAFSARTTIGPVVIQEFRPGEKATILVERDESLLDSIGETLGEWVARLHAVEGAGFGPVLGEARFEDWPGYLMHRVRRALEVAPLGSAGAPRRIEDLFRRLGDRIRADVRPSLIHGDLYLDNVLLKKSTPVCLLDFEHAIFADRFCDFGKINELLFEWWPRIRTSFMSSYHRGHPPADDDGIRMDIGIGLYELTHLAYFNRWQPDLVPVYRDRLVDWIERVEPVT